MDFINLMQFPIKPEYLGFGKDTSPSEEED